MPLGARHDRVTGNAGLYTSQLQTVSSRIAAHFVGHSPSHLCLQRWDFSWCSGLVLIFCPCLPTLSKLQSWPGRHISWFSVQPALWTSAPNLSSIARVAQEGNMLPWLQSPNVSVCLSFLLF